MSKELLNLALEALESLIFNKPFDHRYGDVITALREGLAEQPAQQEPVALEEYDAGILNDFGGGNVEWWQDYIRAELGRAYEHYQSQMAAPPLPAQQEPVAWMQDSIELYVQDHPSAYYTIPLYTSPPAQRTWQGLTNDEYDAICDKHSEMSDFDFLEDIEAKLKEKNT